MRFVGALLIMAGGYLVYWWGLLGHDPWSTAGSPVLGLPSYAGGTGAQAPIPTLGSVTGGKGGYFYQQGNDPTAGLTFVPTPPVGGGPKHV